jgi:hypothetical protein
MAEGMKRAFFWALAQTRGEYPDWICGDCGGKYGRQRGSLSTCHEGKCGWCGETKPVTEPRDFGYPKHPGYKV